MTRQRDIRLTSLGLLGIGVMAGIIVGLKQFMGFEFPGWAKVGILALVMGLAAILTWSWWKLLDEVAREAHKFSWYWGGSAGMAVAGIVMILVDNGQIAVPRLLLSGQHGDYVLGAASVMFAQVIGYTVAWVGWWWSRR